MRTKASDEDLHIAANGQSVDTAASERGVLTVKSQSNELERGVS